MCGWCYLELKSVFSLILNSSSGNNKKLECDVYIYTCIN